MAIANTNQAYQEGKRAANRGEPRSKPPVTDPMLRSEWLRGWDEVDAHDGPADSFGEYA